MSVYSLFEESLFDTSPIQDADVRYRNDKKVPEMDIELLFPDKWEIIDFRIVYKEYLYRPFIAAIPESDLVLIISSNYEINQMLNKRNGWIPIYVASIYNVRKYYKDGGGWPPVIKESEDLPDSNVPKYRKFTMTVNIMPGENLYEITDIKEKIIENDPRYGNIYEIPSVFGYWNIFTNRVVASTSSIKIKKQLAGIIKNTDLYKSTEKYREKKEKNTSSFTVGFEQEALFLKDGIPYEAHKAIVDFLDNKFQIPKNYVEQYYLHERGAMNDIFNASKIGTDSRRIIFETRTASHVVDLNRIKRSIIPIIEDIRDYYIKTYNNFPEYDLRLGGGQNGESLGCHVHFSDVEFDPQFIITLNKIFGKPLQAMSGGQRPKKINPPDRMTLDLPDGQRDWNTYGVIKNNIKTLWADFRNPRGVQVRAKQYEKNKYGYEWRIPPSFWISPIFLENFLLSLFWLMRRIKENPDFNFKNIYKFQPYVEFLYMSKSQSLLESPYNFWLDKYRGCRLSNLEMTLGCVDKMIYKEYNYKNIPHQLIDYIPYKKIYAKLEHGKNTVFCPLLQKRHLSLLMKIYNIQDFKVETTGLERCFRIRSSRIDENKLLILMKIICILPITEKPKKGK